MKNKQLLLEHSDMMQHSREVVQLSIPVELDVITYSIFGFFLMLFAGMFLVKINDVKKESGIIRTLQNCSSVRNIISGKIENIYFTPEQYVHKGDILYSLEKDTYIAKKSNFEKDMENLQEQISCLGVLIECCVQGKKLINKTENQFINSQLDEYFSSLNYLKNQIEILKYKLRKEKDLPSSLINFQQIEEAELNLRMSKLELEKYKTAFLSDATKRKKEYEIQYEKLQKDYICLENEYAFLDVRSPIDGYIQEITPLNTGDYVFANQEILNIIPNDNENFRVELAIKTKDVGELYPGMTVKYRLSAFPFYEYKGAEGKIISIDSDVRKSGNGELFYRAFADIDKVTFFNKQGDEFLLKSGIEVDARIIMRKISLFYFILRKLDLIQ